MARTRLLDDITEFIRDAYRGDMSNGEVIRRSVALSTGIKVALEQLDRADTDLVESLTYYQRRILGVLFNRFVPKPVKPKWRFMGRDDDDRLRFVCDTGEERLIPADQFWKK